ALLVTLSVEGGAGLEAEPVAKVTPADVWKVSEQAAPTITDVGDGRQRWQQTLRVEPLQPSEQQLTLEPLRYREAGGAGKEATWGPFAVNVTQQVAKADVGEARDITPIEELPPVPAVETGWLPWAGLGLAVVVAVAVVVASRRQRRQRPAPVV